VTTADLTDERLREIAASDPLVLAICAAMGDPSWSEVRQNAAELLAARAEIRRLRAIEAAARKLDVDQAEPDGLWVTVPILLLGGWDELRAALAAKEDGK
jgi:hypothetical protein